MITQFKRPINDYILSSIRFWSFAVGLLFFSCDEEKLPDTVESPDGKLLVTIIEKEGQLFYQVSHEDFTLLNESRLGVVFDKMSFTDSLEIVGVDERIIDESYKMITGKRRENRDFANEKTFTVRNPEGRTLKIIFRAYNDGMAFRYQLEGDEVLMANEEKTEFALNEDAKAWMQGLNMQGPVYEEEFEYKIPVGTVSPMYSQDGWAFPALFNVENSWMLLTESDLDANYCATHIANKEDSPVYKIALPVAEKDTFRGAALPEVRLPWTSPWRIAVIGNIQEVFASNLMNHVAKPSILENDEWVRPGRSSWGWLYNSNSPRDINALKEYIDLASEMNWEYSLVDANWHELENLDQEELINYAKEKNVGLFVWYNSGGPHNKIEGSFEFTEGPRDKMHDPEIRRAEFAKLQEWGIKGIKVDFFGSDRQYLIGLYHEILKDAADFEIMVNFHGCTIPRGWQRTYPHLMTMEAVKGNERFKSSKNRGYEYTAPRQNAILPYTRNVIGSMDITPVTFTQNALRHITTHGHELALSVVFESGVQHFPDTYAGYMSLAKSAREFLTEVPASWDESRLLSGYPGKNCLVARRKGTDWYIGGINGYFEPHTFQVDLSFLQESTYSGELITNSGQNADAFEVRQVNYPVEKQLTLEVKADDGFVIKLVKE